MSVCALCSVKGEVTRQELQEMVWPPEVEHPEKAQQSMRTFFSNELRKKPPYKGHIIPENDVVRCEGVVFDVQLLREAHARGDHRTVLAFTENTFLDLNAKKGTLNKLQAFQEWVEDQRREFQSFRWQAFRAVKMQEVQALLHAGQWQKARDVHEGACRVLQDAYEEDLPEMDWASWDRLATVAVLDRPVYVEPEEGLLDCLMGEVRGKGVQGPFLRLVLGEVGVGKTRLLEELALRGKALWLRGEVRLNGEPLGVFRAAAQQALDDPELRALLFPERERLRLLCPQLGVHEPVPVLQGEALIAALWEQVRVFLGALRKHLDFLLLDDLHEFDAVSLSKLSEVIRSSTGLRVVGTALQVGAGTAGGFAEVLEQFRAEKRIEEHELGMLRERQFLWFVAQLLGGVNVQDFVGKLWDFTGGNPLFTLEALRELTQARKFVLHPDGRLVNNVPLEELVLQDSARSLMRARVQHLPKETVLALEAAAVLSLPVLEGGLLARLLNLKDEVLTEHLRPAFSQGLLQARGEGRFEFRYVSLRHALLKMLSRTRYRALNVQAAVTLKDHLPAEVIALHFEKGGEYQRGVEWRLRAAEWHFMRAEYPQALQHIETGLLHAVEREAFQLLSLRVKVRAIMLDFNAWELDLQHLMECAEDLSDRGFWRAAQVLRVEFLFNKERRNSLAILSLIDDLRKEDPTPDEDALLTVYSVQCKFQAGNSGVTQGLLEELQEQLKHHKYMSRLWLGRLFYLSSYLKFTLGRVSCEGCEMPTVQGTDGNAWCAKCDLQEARRCFELDGLQAWLLSCDFLHARLLESTGDVQGSAEMLKALVSRAQVLNDQQNFNMALQQLITLHLNHGMDARPIAELIEKAKGITLNTPHMQGYHHQQLGVLYRLAGKYKLAFDHFALAKSASEGNLEQLGQVFGLIIQSYLDLGELRFARQQRKALLEVLPAGVVPRLVRIQEVRECLMLGGLEQAEEALKALFTEDQHPNERAELAVLSAQLHFLRKNFLQALTDLKEVRDVRLYEATHWRMALLCDQSLLAQHTPEITSAISNPGLALLDRTLLAYVAASVAATLNQGTSVSWEKHYLNLYKTLVPPTTNEPTNLSRHFEAMAFLQPIHLTLD